MANDSSVITRVNAQKISQNYYNNYGYVPNVPQQQVQTQSEYTFPGPYSS